MPGRVLQPLSLNSMLEALSQRIGRLESGVQPQALTAVASATVSPSNQTFTPASLSDWQAVAGTPVTFTLTRSAQLLMLYNVGLKTAGVTGQIAYARANIVGQATTNSTIFDKNNTGWANGNGWFQTFLAAGTYTVQIEVSADSGQTVTVTQGNIDVWKLSG